MNYSQIILWCQLTSKTKYTGLDDWKLLSNIGDIKNAIHNWAIEIVCFKVHTVLRMPWLFSSKDKNTSALDLQDECATLVLFNEYRP
jgi:hypothetical protein